MSGATTAEVCEVITTIATVGAVAVAYFQLRDIKITFKLTADSLKISSLMAVLEIESQLGDRRAALDRASVDVKIAAELNEPKGIQQAKARLHTSSKQEYFNTLDCLCFCILKGYVQDKDWRAEYREVLRQTIEHHEKDFLAASPYRNIISLNSKWQSDS